MGLPELLLQREGVIADQWLERTLATYSPDAAAFFDRRKNEFANPVGHTLRVGITGILASLLRDNDPTELCTQLEPIIKIRSVQDLTPGRAVSFVFLLKDAVRAVLSDELSDVQLLRELEVFERHVDQLALFAFDVFTKSRDKLHQLRINDVKRRVSGLMRRMGIGLDDLDSNPGDPSDP